jgi:hypothetical protein
MVVQRVPAACTSYTRPLDAHVSRVSDALLALAADLWRRTLVQIPCYEQTIKVNECLTQTMDFTRPDGSKGMLRETVRCSTHTADGNFMPSPCRYLIRFIYIQACKTADQSPHGTPQVSAILKTALVRYSAAVELAPTCLSGQHQKAASAPRYCLASCQWPSPARPSRR